MASLSHSSEMVPGVSVMELASVYICQRSFKNGRIVTMAERGGRRL